MEINVKLSGFLKEKTPPGGKLSLCDEATIADALATLEIPTTSVQALLVNGKMERNRERQLVAGDELNLLPPVGGG